MERVGKERQKETLGVGKQAYRNANKIDSDLHELPLRVKLLLQLTSVRLALLEAHEELIEKADDDSIDADVLSFSPLLQLGPGLYAKVEELRLG